MRKLLCIIMTAAVLLGLFSPAVSALSIGTEVDVPMTMTAFSCNAADELKIIVSDYDGFLSYCSSELKKGNTEINIEKFNYPYNSESTKLLTYFINYILVDCNIVNAYTYTYSGSKILKFKIKTEYTQSQIVSMVNAMTTAINQLTNDIKNLSDVEKALVLHDRLIQRCSYQQIKQSDGKYSTLDYTTYGSLIVHISVCAGYAKAYKALLNKLGVECYVVTSETMNHAWNVVVINGKRYHVDCTWDGDNTTYAYGRVSHKNFLRSTAGIIATGHKADDFDTTPVDTTYDSGWFWSSITSYGIQCIKNTLYVPKYISKEGTYLMTVKNLQIADKVCQMASYNKTACDSTYYYYNTSHDIRKVNVSTGATTVIYSNTEYLAGIRILDNKLYIDTGSTSKYSNEYRETHLVVLSLPLKYKVTLSETTTVKSLEPGQTYGYLPTLSKEGYEFKGWIDESGNIVKSSSVFSYTKDITIRPYWKEILHLRDDADAKLDSDNDLLIIPDFCDVAALFKSGTVTFSGEIATGAKVKVNNETLTIVLIGDLNGDGLRDGRDAVLDSCVSHGILNAGNYDIAYVTAAEITGDSIIDEKDFRILINNGLKLDNNINISDAAGIDYAFYVPETVYLEPSENASVFSFYVDYDTSANGLGLRTGENTEGNILFVNRDADLIESITCSGADVSFSVTSSDTSCLETKILSGTLANPIKEYETSVITWEVRYISGGVSHIARAYSTCYAPLAGNDSAIAAGGFAQTSKNITWMHSAMSITSSVWATGLNSIAGGESGYKFSPNGNYPYTSAAGTYSLAVDGKGMNTKSNTSHGVSSSVSAESGTGYLTVDTSRYTDINQIPGFRFGMDINNVTNDNEPASQYVEINSKRVFDCENQIAGEMSGYRVYDSAESGNNYSLPVDTTLKSFNITGFASCGGFSRTDSVTGKLYIDINCVNKALLRSKYNGTLKTILMQGADEKAEGYESYFRIIRFAQSVLGNPSSDKDDIDHAVDLLDYIDKDLSSLRDLKTITQNHVKVYENNGAMQIKDVHSRLLVFVQDESIDCQKMNFTGYTYMGYKNGFDLSDIENPDENESFTVNSGNDNSIYTFYYRANRYYVGFSGNAATSGSMTDQEFIYDIPQRLKSNEFSRSHTVAYDYDGASSGNTVTQDTAVSLFNGWSLYSYSSSVYGNNDIVLNLRTDDLGRRTLYAKWNLGSVTLPTPKKTGYTFAGWYNGSTRVGAGGDLYKPSSDVTLTAKWTAV